MTADPLTLLPDGDAGGNMVTGGTFTLGLDGAMGRCSALVPVMTTVMIMARMAIPPTMALEMIMRSLDLS